MLFKSHGECWPFRFTRKLTLLDEANSPQTFVGCGFNFQSPFQSLCSALWIYLVRILSVGCLGTEWGFSIQVSESLMFYLGSETSMLSVGAIPGVYTQLGLILPSSSLLNVPASPHFPEACYFSAPTRKLGLCFPALSHRSILIYKPSGRETGEAKSNGSSLHTLLGPVGEEASSPSEYQWFEAPWFLR